METKRQQKFSGIIQKDLAEIFQREGSNYLPNTMVTVTKVRITPDLAIARVYLSFFNSPDPTLLAPAYLLAQSIRRWPVARTSRWSC